MTPFDGKASQLEYDFWIALLRAKDAFSSCGLPEYQYRIQASGHNYTVDFAWPEHKCIVELDGYTYHFYNHGSAAKHYMRQREIEREGWHFHRWIGSEVLSSADAVICELCEIKGLVYPDTLAAVELPEGGIAGVAPKLGRPTTLVASLRGSTVTLKGAARKIGSYQ